MPRSTHSSSQAESRVAKLAEPDDNAPRDDVTAQANTDQALAAELEAARAELATDRAEKEAAEAACATAGTEKTAAEAARAAADVEKTAAETARALADAEVHRLNTLAGGAAAGASAGGAPGAGATLSALQIAQMIAGVVTPLTQLIQDNKLHTERYVQALATHQANTEQNNAARITQGL